MDRYRMLPSYRYYDVEGTSPLTLDKSVGKPLRDYKIYGNSIQDGTPSPDNPVEIQGCGDKSKNLLTADDGYVYSNNYNANIVHYDKNTQVFTINGIGMQVHIPLEKIVPSGTTVSLFAEIVNDDYEIVNKLNIGGYGVSNIWQNDLTFTPTSSKKQSKVFTTTDDVDRFCIFIYSSWQAQNVKMRITYAIHDKELTEYEPYGYKIPIEVGGKNLFDVNGDINRDYKGNPSPNQFHGNHIVSGNQFLIKTSTWATSSFGQFINVRIGKTYTVSLNVIEWGSCPTLEVELKAINPNALIIKPRINTGENTMTFSFTATTEVVHLAFAQTGISYSDNGLIIGNVQVEEGDTATEYEPYRKEITNIYLDEPLYKIGDYADYIDFKNGKVVKQINKISVNGTEEWSANTTKNLTQVFAQTTLKPHSGKPQAYCSNRFIADNSGDTEKVAIQQDLFIAVNKTRASTVDEFKEWLGENPTDIFYTPVKPTEQPITLPPILTHKGTNVISVDTNIQPSNMQIQYYK